MTRGSLALMRASPPKPSLVSPSPCRNWHSVVATADLRVAESPSEEAIGHIPAKRSQTKPNRLRFLFSVTCFRNLGNEAKHLTSFCFRSLQGKDGLFLENMNGRGVRSPNWTGGKKRSQTKPNELRLLFSVTCFRNLGNEAKHLTSFCFRKLQAKKCLFGENMNGMDVRSPN